VDNDRLARLERHLTRQRAHHYLQAADTLQQALDPLAHDDPRRPRLIKLLKAARQRAEQIEAGRP
jgi:cytochrome c-type biogenesis protein CcmH/NrfG